MVTKTTGKLVRRSHPVGAATLTKMEANTTGKRSGIRLVTLTVSKADW